jgi:hypothetical protein
MGKVKKRTIRNNYRALARHFGVFEIADLGRRLKDEGWWQNTKLTIMRRACGHGTPADIDAMVELGAEVKVDIRPALNESALHIAAQYGNAKNVVHLITGYGMSPDFKVVEPPSSSPTPLQTLITRGRLASSGTYKAFLALLDHGASVNGIDNNGTVGEHIPLCLLFRQMGQLKFPDANSKAPERYLEALLSRGADPKLKYWDRGYGSLEPAPLLQLLRQSSRSWHWIPMIEKAFAGRGHMLDWEGKWIGGLLKNPPPGEPYEENEALWRSFYTAHQERELDKGVPKKENVARLRM